jgi:hypothetical protein
MKYIQVKGYFERFNMNPNGHIRFVPSEDGLYSVVRIKYNLIERFLIWCKLKRDRNNKFLMGVDLIDK